jgi:hypothetical protein
MVINTLNAMIAIRVINFAIFFLIGAICFAIGFVRRGRENESDSEDSIDDERAENPVGYFVSRRTRMYGESKDDE